MARQSITGLNQGFILVGPCLLHAITFWLNSIARNSRFVSIDTMTCPAESATSATTARVSVDFFIIRVFLYDSVDAVAYHLAALRGLYAYPSQVTKSSMECLLCGGILDVAVRTIRHRRREEALDWSKLRRLRFETSAGTN